MVPEISVVMPAYNSGKYIKEAIESVLSQTYGDFEIVVIDDGSNDNTGDVVKSIGDDRIKYYRQDNRGQSAARNKGVGYASGRYIAFVDSDDILQPQCFEKLVSAIHINDSDIAVCGYEKFYDETNEVYYKRMPRDWEIEFEKGIRQVFIYAPWVYLYKKEFIDRYDLKFSEGEQLEDGPYCCLANLLADSVVSVDYVGLRYRLRDNSTMANVRKENSRPKPPYRGVVHMIEEFNKYNRNEAKRDVMEYCAVKIMTGFVTNMYKRVDKQSRHEICAFCHKTMKRYYPNISRNKYVRIGRLRKLPLNHRVAIRLFIVFDRLGLLYPFSLCVSRFL